MSESAARATRARSRRIWVSMAIVFERTSSDLPALWIPRLGICARISATVSAIPSHRGTRRPVSPSTPGASIGSRGRLWASQSEFTVKLGAGLQDHRDEAILGYRVRKHEGQPDRRAVARLASHFPHSATRTTLVA